MHYYQFHIGDYKSHTHHLSLMEDLAYRRLLDHYYLHQLPIKQRDIARQIGMRDYEQEVLTILDEFFLSTESGYINPRADKEIKAFIEHQATSAYGAFVRDNPNLKQITDKQLFIEHHMAGTITDYVNLLKSSCVVDVPIKATSRGDDATNNQEPITINHKPIKSKATVVACPESVNQQVWDDWMAVRKDKKAKTLTETGWKMFIKQVEKAGWSLEQAISHCCLKQWVGFEADWVAQKVSQQDIIRQTTPTPANHDAALRKIEEDRKKAAKPSAEVQAKINEILKGKVA